MNAPKSKPRTILTGDGELQETDSDQAAIPAVHTSPVFCNHCGTANQASSSFCRGCGQSLDAQVIDEANVGNYSSPLKRKRDDLSMQYVPQPQSTVQVIGAVISDIATLLILGGLAVWTLNLGQGGVTALLIIIWFFIEASRHGWMRSK